MADAIEIRLRKFQPEIMAISQAMGTAETAGGESRERIEILINAVLGDGYAKSQTVRDVFGEILRDKIHGDQKALTGVINRFDYEGCNYANIISGVCMSMNLISSGMAKKHEQALSMLKTIGNWKNKDSSIPAYEGETEPLAMKRNITFFRKLVEREKDKFTGEQLSMLQTDIDTLERTVEKIEELTSQVQGLYDQITTGKKRRK